MSDEDVWKLKYKIISIEAGLTDKLQKHIVKTKSDNFEVWQGLEKWNLALLWAIVIRTANKDNIKDKVWMGRKDGGIKQAEEKLT